MYAGADSMAESRSVEKRDLEVRTKLMSSYERQEAARQMSDEKEGMIAASNSCSTCCLLYVMGTGDSQWCNAVV